MHAVLRSHHPASLNVSKQVPSVRFALLAALWCGGLLLGGCGTPRKPAPIDTVRDLALVSILGEESGIKIVAIDGVMPSAGAPIGRRPTDAPPGVHGGIGVWLRPGSHLIQVQFVRDIEGGISFTKVELPVVLRAGRTYIPYALAASARGQTAMALADHGAHFPVDCLPATLNESRPRDALGRRTKFTRADILACRQRPQA